MKAAICTAYGEPDVIEFENVEKPVPQANEVLVKIAFAGVTAGDARIRASRFPEGFEWLGRLALGVFKPRNPILGSEFSGTVEQIGSKVTEFQVGDRVMGFHVFGSHAEYICLEEKYALAKIPEQMSLEQAAALPFGGTTAMYFLAKAALRKGEKILINGSTGEVGVAAVQLANARGADVTAVCSGEHTELVHTLGADATIDYTQQDFRNLPELYDVIFDTVGNLSFESCVAKLKPNGRFVTTVDKLSNTIFGPLTKKGPQGQRYMNGTASERKEDLHMLMEIFSEGKFKALIEQVYDFSEIRKAHARVDSGKKVGSVLLRMA